MSNHLFREHALNSQRVGWYGTALIIRPLSVDLVTAFSVLATGALVAFLALFSYTKHDAVSGQLVPSLGLIKIYTPQLGIIVEKNVAEGQAVHPGDVLYVISSDHADQTQTETQQAVSADVSARIDSLRATLAQSIILQSQETAEYQNKASALADALQTLDDLINTQKSRADLANATATKYAGLLGENFVSQEDVDEKQADYLDQRYRLESLEQDHVTASQEYKAAQTDLQDLPLKHQTALAEIEREIDSASEELEVSEAKRRVVVTAPEAGIATAAIGQVGQAVDSNQPLVVIVPQTEQLQAQLYAPSNAIGFVKLGDSVVLRYQAYPYQQFGSHHGVVTAISRTALSSAELTGLNAFSSDKNEPLYRIIVVIDSQTVTAYGKPRQLQASMMVDADIVQEKRRLFQWALEPLYSLTGKL